jgi:hypothetical protein
MLEGNKNEKDCCRTAPRALSRRRIESEALGRSLTGDLEPEIDDPLRFLKALCPRDGQAHRCGSAASLTEPDSPNVNAPALVAPVGLQHADATDPTPFPLARSMVPRRIARAPWVIVMLGF